MKSVILKFGAVLAMSAAFFFAGYRYASALYGEDIAALREDYACRALALEEKYREKELPRRSCRHGKSATRLLLVSTLCLLMSTGGAVKQTPPAVDCPQLVRLPASLSESNLRDAQNLSSEVQAYFVEVSRFLSGLQ